jgi:hypothetical protein
MFPHRRLYEQRVSAAVGGMSSLIEPIAIVILGGVVGMMLIALYLPHLQPGSAMRRACWGIAHIAADRSRRRLVAGGPHAENRVMRATRYAT